MKKLGIRLLFLVVPVTLILSVSACRHATGPTPDTMHLDTTHHTAGDTGMISGMVMEGPITPVSQPGDPNEAPLAGANIIISYALSGGAGTGAIAATVTSDTGGRFFARLKSGNYHVSPQAFGNSIYPRPQNPDFITLPANTTVLDTLHYDTGIR